MWHLAIESSGLAGSVALGKSNVEEPFAVVGQRVLTNQSGSVRWLAPAIQQLLHDHNVTAQELSLISVTSGPGSFTGLRVGLATAKMLSLAWNTPIAPVDTLAAIAQGLVRASGDSELPISPDRPRQVVTVLNAFRKQVFAAAWCVEHGRLVRRSPSQVLDAHVWQESPWSSLSPEAEHSSKDESQSPNVPLEPILVCGPGLSSYRPDANKSLQAPESRWQPMASDVGYLGFLLFESGQAVDALRLAPNYIRSSAAEEKHPERTAP